MPDIRPFRGVRYADAASISDVVCPPYDVISEEEQRALHERHEHNAIRLELALERDGGYSHLGELFGRWVDEGVLTRDDPESLYVYRQDFEDPGGGKRRVAGVLGALALEPFGGGVLPHERTMPGPKQDRLALMRALPANVSPIYAIYRGAGGLAAWFTTLEDRPPAYRFADDSGILHRLWVIAAPAEVAMLREALAPGPLVIADGHHRYETALTFHEEMTAAGAPGEHDAIMCFCVDADAEGLVVLPYHRMFRTGLDPGAIERALRDRFAARDAGDPSAAVAASRADHAFAFLLPQGAFLVELDREAVVAALGRHDPSWLGLGVVALHEIVLPQVFRESSLELAFTKDPAEIERRMKAGWTGGVLTRAVAATDVVDVARSGERMPQKASYFWPKAATGLVFRPFGP